MIRLFATAALGALLVGCSSGGSSDPTFTPTSRRGAIATTTPRSVIPQQTRTPVAVSGFITGPAPQATALAGNTVTDQFVVERATGGVWTITANAGVVWFDDATLLLPCITDQPIGGRGPCGYWLLSLDGDESALFDEPPPTTIATPDPLISADGLWRLTTSGAESFIEETQSGRRIAVPSNENLAWSPSGHVLATGGGRCGNVPVVFVDPDATPPTQTVDVGAAIIRSYVWRPDGSGIALAVIRNSAQSQILFVSARDTTVETLVPLGSAQIAGEPIVGPWNESGTHLLFGIYSGRPCPY